MAEAFRPPPLQRIFTAPSGRYLLVLSVPDPAQPAQAELFAVEADVRRPLWRLALRHAQGPRSAVVTDRGFVVLLDEWVQRPSRHALVLIDPQGLGLAHYSVDELAAALQVPAQALACQTAQGRWMEGEPRLSADGAALFFAVGPRQLRLVLASGELSVAGLTSPR
jgi:hypothetical protein